MFRQPSLYVLLLLAAALCNAGAQTENDGSFAPAASSKQFWQAGWDNFGEPLNLTKSGPATLTLSGANTYSGPTSVNAGTLQLGAANRIAATSDITIAAGALLNLNNFAEAAGSIAGAGNIALGTATLTAALAVAPL